MDANDLALERALDARNRRALAAELRRRLDAATCGTGISFRIGWGYPPAWRGTARGKGAPEHRAWAFAAADALLAHARSVESRTRAPACVEVPAE
jgi:hypothetical protein